MPAPKAHLHIVYSPTWVSPDCKTAWVLDVNGHLWRYSAGAWSKVRTTSLRDVPANDAPFDTIVMADEDLNLVVMDRTIATQ